MLSNLSWALILIGISVIALALEVIEMRKIRRDLDTYKSMLKDATPIVVTYDEEETLKHLQYIVDEAIDEYVLYNITPVGVEYINSAIEQRMIDSLTTSIPERISPTLINKLGIIYNPEYVGKYIGSYIFMKVTEFVIAFNNDINN